MYLKCSQGTVTPDYVIGICPECNTQIVLTKDHTQICKHFKAELEKHERNCSRADKTS